MACATAKPATSYWWDRYTVRRSFAVLVLITPIFLLSLPRSYGASRSAKAQQGSRPIHNSQEATPLETGKPIERELAGDEVHAYSIQMTAGHFAKVMVVQRGVDVVVSVSAPDGKEFLRQGAEPVTFVAETSGSYRLEVSMFEKLATPGRYELKIDDLRTAGPEDKKSGEIGDRINRASELNELGYVYRARGDYVRALEAYQKSVTLSEAAGNKAWTAFALNNMGWTSFYQGDYAPAFEYSRKTLALSEELGNKFLVADTLNQMSALYIQTGNFAQALNYAQRGLGIIQSLGNNVTLSQLEIGIGLVYENMGDNAKALEHYRKSLAVSEVLGKKVRIADALTKIAGAFTAQGDYPRALEYALRSLALMEEEKAVRGTIFSLQTIGRIQLALGNHSQALKYFQKALALSESVGERSGIARALNGISNSYFRLGNHAQALEFAQRGVAVAKHIGSRNLLHGALNRTGTSYLYLNELQNARSAFEQAIEVVESLRASIAGSDARSDFFAAAAYPYQQNVNVLMQLHKQRPSEGYDAMALQMSERGRARSLLETLSEAGADIRLGVDQTLLTRERTLQQRLNAGAERQTRLLSGKHTEAQATELQKEVEVLTRDYQQVEAQIRQSSPRYAALTQPTPLTVQEIQRDVLDADTALLEYALGWDRSYLWVVTQTSVKSFELPKGAEIEPTVRRVVELLSDGKRWTTSAQIGADYSAAAGHLSRMLLPPDMMSQLNVKRLIIVGDGALQYLPFGALPSPTKVQGSNSKNGRPVMGAGQPLIVDYEIVTLPSASTLAVLRRESANRARPPKSVAILADPVFEKTDERVQRATAQGSYVGTGQPSSDTREVGIDQLINSRALLRALEFQSSGGANGSAPEQLHITRLPFTRFEAEDILKSAPSGKSIKVTDFRANREAASNPSLAEYRFVHFATHGILNSEHPELSG
ncbi:MAG TPA: tetratricopeptide repeat protein, partial [Pyrinomonadaceae bacterium]|nr:tetratricopeptide repeat protein [Pyrinomonadaceae bacterium]